MKVEEWLGTDNELGKSIWSKKYKFNGENFDKWVTRVSGGNKELAKLIYEKKFLFGGRTLSNRGTGKKASFSNCYSYGFVKDDLDGLLQAAKDIAMTYKSQGGQGLSLSKVRPIGTGINGGQFTSDGIIPFMEIYNRVTESISQGGSRKGALLMSLDAWHKESDRFIKIKSEEGRIQKANLSVEIDDEFMRAVKKFYDSGEVVTKHIKRVYDGNAVEYDITPINLYRLMIEKAWDWGEPGCIFTNRFRNYNMMEKDSDYIIETCNPCGEQPLPPNGACNLGSINLSEFVKNPFTPQAEFDFEEFNAAVKLCIRALDAVIDENVGNHALESQRQMATKYRNIGLGIMGLYDMFCKMGYTYGEADSIYITDQIMSDMFRSAVFASNEMAKESGCFPGYKPELFDSEIMKRHFSEEELVMLRRDGLRNCSLLSIAPAGSIATMLNVSTGMEPAFSISYNRKTESLNGGEEKIYKVYTGIAKEYLETTGESELPKYFVTAGDINWVTRVDLQSVLQDHVDTGISSTINIAHEATVEEIEKLYLYAWEKGLKGITIFRDGCMRMGILTKKPAEENKTKVLTNAELYNLKRGETLHLDEKKDVIGLKRKIRSGCGNIHVGAYFSIHTGELYETFFNKGSKGGCMSFMIGLSRVTSKAARDGMPFEDIIDVLKDTPSCSSYSRRNAKYGDTSRGSSCPAAIAYALEEMREQVLHILHLDSESLPTATSNPVKEAINNMTPVEESQKEMVCPECGEETLIYEGGCISCPSCGWTKCE